MKGAQTAMQPTVEKPEANERRGRSSPAPAAQDGALTASELWRAVKEQRVISLYQPQVELATGRTVAVESLARIVDERGKLIAPERFIAGAEASGVIAPLGRTVLQQTCQALAEWRAAGLTVQRVCFNVSSRQLAVDPTLPRFAQRTAEEFGLTLDDMEFEIAEQDLLDAAPLALATIDELLELGGRLVVDDFRARHRSIARLAELDVNSVKLDPSIVSRLPQDAKARLLASHVLALTRNRGISVVAARVETREQIEFLREGGCSRAQGYVYTRPVPANLLPKVMRFS